MNIRRELRKIQKKTGWSWEKMNREMHSGMGYTGPCHTTLFRIANGRVKKIHPLIKRYLTEAINNYNFAIRINEN